MRPDARRHISQANPGSRRPPHGLTLLELLLALAITALVGLAMSTAMSATARGMTGAGDSRSALQRANVAYTRLRGYTTSGLCLLASDPDRGFVIWLHDENPDKRVNLSEMRVFWYESESGSMRVERLALPESWTDDMVEDYDIAIDPADDFFVAMSAQSTAGHTESERLVDGLAGWTVEYDGNDSQLSPRFRLGLSVSTSDGAAEDVMMTFGLINHTAPR